MGSTWDVDAVPSKAALSWFQEKLVLPPEEYYALEQAARAKAFTVSGLADLDMTSDVWEAVGRAIQEGTSQEDFVRSVSEMLEGQWGEGGSRLETIFRTNVQSALSIGRFEQNNAPAVRATHPFQRFDAVEDEATTDICRMLDGQVYRADDPFLLSHNPPLHFNCRTELTAITEEEAGEAGGVSDHPPDGVGPAEGFGQVTQEFEPDLSSRPPELASLYELKEHQS